MFILRVLLTALALIQGAATVLIDFNRTHATNPLWPGHSRFHVVWQSFNQPLFAIVEALLIWCPGAELEARFYLAAALTSVPCVGFVLAQWSRGMYAGTLSDPNGIKPLRFEIAGRKIQIDGNAAAVYSAFVVLIGLTTAFRFAAR